MSRRSIDYQYEGALMRGWTHSVVAAIGSWRLERQTNWQAARIARDIHPALWESVRRKIASASANDLAAYAKVRAAQLSQECIDSRMQANPALSGAYASKLLAKATSRALALVLATAASARRSAA
jgi:hypothetical protein